MPFQAPITIGSALERMHRHEYVLPAIQREFVWGTGRICRLFDSLMRGYPVGSFLFWKLDGDSSSRYTFYDFVRNYHAKDAPHCPTLDVEKGAPVTAILDGQQRLTALNIGLRGSHAEKLPYKRANNAQAYPVKHLYLDLLHAPSGEDLDMEYRFTTEVARGCRDFVVVTPAQVLRPALLAGASRYVLLHTHPDGGGPSAADHAVTRRLVAAGAVVGLRLQAHLVVGPKDVWDCLRPDQDLTA